MVRQHAHIPTQRDPTWDRGRPPRELGYFFRTVRRAAEAGALGSLYEMFNVIPVTAAGLSPESFRCVNRGELLCYAYEVYRSIVQSPLIQFEHAVLLATALADRQQISLQVCPDCDARILVGHFGDPHEWCTYCRPTTSPPTIPADRPTGPFDPKQVV
jgi:hypothetical protein